MATTAEQNELHKTIWAIANELRGAVDGWNFKAYVLGTLFYRFISENLTDYIDNLQHQAGMPDFSYAALSDTDAAPAKDQIVAEKGYFILPSQLFSNVCQRAKADDNLNETLSRVFNAIEASAIGTPSEADIRGLFSDFVVDSNLLGNSVTQRNSRLYRVLLAVQNMDLGKKAGQTDNDPFGDAYEYLMNMYASGAGKSGGEFFTPQEVSSVLARIATVGNPKIDKVYDPACGSGSLLLRFARIIGKHNPNLKYYGQEINPTTYNLCRINMFLHDVNFNNFDIRQEDTLLKPQHLDEAGNFDAIVSNPPYSLSWEGKDNTLLINDARYAPAGVLAPKSAADLAFVMHMLYHLAETGTAAIVEFPGVLYRSGAEMQIRKYLVENNYIDTVIQLPANLFFGVGIATCIIVLRKGNRPDSNVLFIDASKLFKKEGNKNKLEPQHQDAIVEAYSQRKEVAHFTALKSHEAIAQNDYNLSVSSYVEQEDNREEVDINELNAHLADIVANCNQLRQEINEIIPSIT